MHDWESIRRYYDQGHTIRECQRNFGFSNASWHAAVARGDVTPRPESVRAHMGRTRRAVRDGLASGKSQAQIARELGLSPAAIAHHARRLGYAAKAECNRRYDWAEVQRYYDAGHSIAECRHRFGMANRTFTDAVARGVIVTRPQAVPLADLLIADRPRNRSHLKSRLLNAGVKQARCEECGLADWRDRPLSLELHHVNGDGEDNRLENLQLLCPNCHSQTDNWGGRGKRSRTVAGEGA